MVFGIDGVVPICRCLQDFVQNRAAIAICKISGGEGFALCLGFRIQIGKRCYFAKCICRTDRPCRKGFAAFIFFYGCSDNRRNGIDDKRAGADDILVASGIDGACVDVVRCACVCIARNIYHLGKRLHVNCAIVIGDPFAIRNCRRRCRRGDGIRHAYNGGNGAFLRGGCYGRGVFGGGQAFAHAYGDRHDIAVNEICAVGLC